jgi:hypothetical protein
MNTAKQHGKIYTQEAPENTKSGKCEISGWLWEPLKAHEYLWKPMETT